MTEVTIFAYIGIGSNIKPKKNILLALDELTARTKILASSPFYWTLPWQRPQQDKYLNGVWKVQTSIPPLDLKFSVLQAIEKRLGRIRQGDKFAARPIDLDLLLYGDLVIKDQRLTLPDPDIRERPFIALNLQQLDPHLILPDTKEKISDIARPFSDHAMVEAKNLTKKIKLRIQNHE